MQKVRTTLSRCMAAIIIGALTWCAVVLLPQDAEGLTLSHLETVTINASAQPETLNSKSPDTITIRVQGVSYTYHTLTSQSSPLQALKPLTSKPAAPTGLKVVSTGSNRVELSWNANREADLRGYRVAYKPAGGTYQSFFTTSNKCSVNGLKNGVKYTLKVKAVNTSGEYSTYSTHVYATPKPTSSSTTTGSSSAPSQANIKVETLAAGTKYATSLYVISSGKPGPVVMVVGGVHGNEKAGYTAAQKITEYKVKRGTLLVIPEANKLAIKANRRAAPGESDLNRAFPQSSSQSPKNTLSRAIYGAIKDYKVDWLIDLHEGYDYYKNSATDSVGQTLIYYPANSTKTTAQAIVNDLNKGISSSTKKFSLLRYPVKGSLTRAAGQYLGVHAMIFETCDNPSLSVRVNYHTQAVNKLLSSLDMR